MSRVFIYPMAGQIVTGRLAPSPTGLIHLGNAWSFLLCWLGIRSVGGKLILRVDDIDPQRSRREFIDAIKGDLLWLGLDWDHEFRQSDRLDLYHDALEMLNHSGKVYPCFCARRELRSLAGAPQAGEHWAPYPGTCRKMPPRRARQLAARGNPCSMRLKCGVQTEQFTDLVYGKMEYAPREFGGDIALRRSDGVIAYQLASAVDDALMGMGLVVRGRDLLPSTTAQILLMRELGYTAPRYAHVPLILDSAGDRLAKRHGSMAIAALRAAGVKSEQIIGYLGQLAGINPSGAPQTPSRLLASFNWNLLPRQDIGMDPVRLPTVS